MLLKFEVVNIIKEHATIDSPGIYRTFAALPCYCIVAVAVSAIRCTPGGIKVRTSSTLSSNRFIFSPCISNLRSILKRNL